MQQYWSKPILSLHWETVSTPCLPAQCPTENITKPFSLTREKLVLGMDGALVLHSSVNFIVYGWGGKCRGQRTMYRSLFHQCGSCGLSAGWQPAPLPAELLCRHMNLVLHLTTVQRPLQVRVSSCSSCRLYHPYMEPGCQWSDTMNSLLEASPDFYRIKNILQLYFRIIL